MRTYESLPKKYYEIKAGEVKVIGSYAYAVIYAAYTGQTDKVFRVEKSFYEKLREDAKKTELYRCEPTEQNLQGIIWAEMIDNCVLGLDPYCVSNPKL